jgi:hypothetical protein
MDDVFAVDIFDLGNGHEICLARVCPSVACCDIHAFHAVNLLREAVERKDYF